MIWSFSEAVRFRRCPREWYFKNKVNPGNGRAGDSLRKEAILLSNLQPIPTWRGKIVDQVISDFLTGEFTTGENQCLRHAEKIFRSELEFARENHYRTPGLVKSKTENYAAFREIEYGSFREEDTEKAWQDICMALKHFFELWDTEKLRPLQEANYRFAQRPLMFDFESVKIRWRQELYENSSGKESKPQLFIRKRCTNVIDKKQEGITTTNAGRKRGAD